MKTKILTWPQAKNLLLTGMCSRVGYYKSYSNTFDCKNGVIYKDVLNYGYDFASEPAAQHYSFHVLK